TMDHEPFFLAVATIAIAITGFTGIVARLDRRSPEYYKAGLQTIVDFSLAAVLIGLLPSAFRIWDPSVDVWRWLTWVLAGFFALEAVIHLVRLYRCYRRREPPRRPSIVFTVLLLTGIIAAVLASNAPSPGLVVLATLWLLFVALLQLGFFLM